MSWVQLPLLVADDAYVVQLPDRDGLDHAFYDELNPTMPVVWVLSAMREFESPIEVGERALVPVTDEATRHIVGLRNRGLYLQLLESLFAHFFANAQFPVAPQAWLARYRPSDLRRLAANLSSRPWTVPDTVPTLALARQLVTWLFGIEQLGALTKEEQDAEADAVLSILGLLSRDYTQEGLDREYNVAKHGIRAMPAPWSLSMSPTGQPDVKATLRATHGTHFHVDERGPPGSRHYFTLRRRSQSWHPERDIRLSQLASWLLHNLIAARRSPANRPFYVFRNIDLDELKQLVQQVQHFEMGIPLDVPDTPVTRAQAGADARALAANYVAFLTGRAEQVARDRAESDK